MKGAIAALSDYNFYKYTSLAIAGCSIGIARLENGIRPIWPEELTHLTWIPMDSVENCFKEMVEVMRLGHLLEKKPPCNKAKLFSPFKFNWPNRRYRGLKQVSQPSLILRREPEHV
jgi:hypothetical protein